MVNPVSIIYYIGSLNQLMKIISASPDFGRALTESEIVDFLTNSKHNAHLGTTDDNGNPNVHPTWYYFDPITGKLYIDTGKHSMKTENLRKNKNIYFCVDDPNPPYKGVKGMGICKIQEDINHNLLIGKKIMLKNLGSIKHPMAQEIIMSEIRAGNGVILEINPTYLSTWDYSQV